MEQRNRWDIKGWVITILLGLILSLGGYSVRSLTGSIESTKQEIQRVDKVAADLVIRQAVDDARYTVIQTGIDEVKAQVRDVRELLIKTHLPLAKKFSE